MERGKLFRAVPYFIAHSTGLAEFVADTIQLPVDMVVQLGKSLLMTSAREILTLHIICIVQMLWSGIKGFRLQDCRIGDSGLRAIVRSLTQLPIQELTLRGCNLTDSSVPFLESILKVSPLFSVIVF